MHTSPRFIEQLSAKSSAQVYVCDICSLSCKEPFLQQYRHLLLLIWQEGSWHHHPGIGMHLLVGVVRCIDECLERILYTSDQP